MKYDPGFMEGYDEWDCGVMEIEELFAAYEPRLRTKLKDQLIAAVDRSDGSDEQKGAGKGRFECCLRQCE